MEVINDFVLSI